MNKYQEAIYNISRVREKTDTAVLMYSAGGKDSIALVDMLANFGKDGKHEPFKKVICYYMYHVQGLEHIVPYIYWAEKTYPNVVVKQIPHCQITYMLHYGVFCDPDPSIKIMKERDSVKYIMQQEQCKYVFNGMKGNDGYMKRMRLKMYLKREGFYNNSGIVYPLASWTNKEVLAYCKMRKTITPFVYDGVYDSLSQGFGIYDLCLQFLYYKYFNDLVKTLKVFPYATTLLTDEQQQDLAARTANG